MDLQNINGISATQDLVDEKSLEIRLHNEQLQKVKK
jgi:hypothetical protein